MRTDVTSVRGEPVTGTAIKEAIETRDGGRLAGFYAADALLRIVDRNNPPGKPRELRGKAAIATFWDDICSRAMTHSVDPVVTDGGRIAFGQACTYPDGAHVLCMAICEIEGGKIARQTAVQAWDE